jgi:hypothetical protein
MGTKRRAFTVKDDHGVKVVENTKRRSILKSKRQEVTRGERKLQNGKLHILCCSPDILTEIESKMTCSRDGEIRNT